MSDAYDRLLQEQRFTEAEQVAKQNIAESTAKEGPETLAVARHIYRLAFAQEGMSRYDEAEANYEKALAVREKILGPDSPDIVTNLLTLGLLLTKRGHLERGASLLRRSFTIHSQAESPDEEFLLSAASGLIGATSAMAQQSGDYSAVSRAIADITVMCGRSFKADDKSLGLFLHDLGEVCRKRRQLGDAQRLLEEALAIRTRVHGPDDSCTLNTAGTLAAVYNDQGRYDLSEPLLQRILDAAEGQDVLRSVRALALNNLAFLHDQQGRFDLALRLYRQAIALVSQDYGPTHPISLSLQRRISALAAMAGGRGRPKTGSGCLSVFLLVASLACIIIYVA